MFSSVEVHTRLHHCLFRLYVQQQIDWLEAVGNAIGIGYEQGNKYKGKTPTTWFACLRAVRGWWLPG